MVVLMFIGCQIIVLVCLHLIIRYWYHRVRSEISEDLHSFITAPDDKTPAPLAILCDSAALLLASRIMQQIKAMLAGTESGLARLENSEALSGAAGGSPWISLLAGILPKRIRNQLLKNPQMLGALANLGGKNHGSSAPGQAPMNIDE